MRLPQDLRDAIRTWRARPGLTAMAVFTLALAAGAAMVCFSLLDAISFKSIPVDHPEELVVITAADSHGQPHGFTAEHLSLLAKSQQVVGPVAAYLGTTTVSATIAGVREPHPIELVGGGYFEVLHLSPVAGRLLEPADDGPTPSTTAKVAVMSERLWRDRFGASPQAIGQTVIVADETLRIVGVMPASFAGLQIETAPDLVVPMQALARDLGAGDGPLLYSYIVGRLRGPTVEGGAQAALTAIWPTIAAATVTPTLDGAARQQALDRRPVVRSIANGFSFLRTKYETTLQLLTALAAWMLATACVSLAGLLLSRAVDRTAEFRIRVALGASRTRLIRQLAIESVCVTACGTAAGLALAAWIAPSLLRLLWPYVKNMTVDLTVDWRMAMATAGTALAIALVLSVAPAWLASREARLGASRHARTVTQSPTRWSQALLALQLSISLVLLIGAGLFLRTLSNLTQVDLGFEPHGLSAIQLAPRFNGYKNLNDEDYYATLLADIASIPGVSSASLMPANPFGGSPPKLVVAPTAARADETGALAGIQMVSPGFFSTLGTSVKGREFSWHDRSDTPLVAVLTQAFATRLFGPTSAVGQQIRVGPAASHHAVTVVGVVPDTRYNDLHTSPGPLVYLSKVQEGQLEGSGVLVRAAPSAGNVEAEVRRRVAARGREDVTRVMTFDDERDVALMRERLAAGLGSAFGGLAMLLVAVGAYGLVSQSVTRRTRELGLRLALGSSRSDLARLVVGNTARLCLVGTVLGLACAWAVGRLATSALYGLTAHDPPVYASAVLILALVVAAATLGPARRATRLNPLDALRAD